MENAIKIRKRGMTKGEMASAIARIRADNFDINDLVAIAEEAEREALMRMPLASVRRDYEFLCGEDAE